METIRAIKVEGNTPVTFAEATTIIGVSQVQGELSVFSGANHVVAHFWFFCWRIVVASTSTRSSGLASIALAASYLRPVAHFELFVEMQPFGALEVDWRSPITFAEAVTFEGMLFVDSEISVQRRT